MGDRVTLAHKLLDNYRSKAVELLVDYLQNNEIRTATERYMGQHNPSPVRLDAAFEQQPKSLRTHSYHADSSLSQGTTRQNISDARHGLHTPSTSAGSVKSHASSLAAAGLERIYLISCDDSADQPVISRSAPVKHNLIGDKSVYGRGLGDSTGPVDELVFVPLPSGGQREERVKKAVNLTWRRRNEFTTNVNTFYIVSARLLNSDVILGSMNPWNTNSLQMFKKHTHRKHATNEEASWKWKSLAKQFNKSMCHLTSSGHTAVCRLFRTLNACMKLNRLPMYLIQGTSTIDNQSTQLNLLRPKRLRVANFKWPACGTKHQLECRSIQMPRERSSTKPFISGPYNENVIVIWTDTE